jgi:hypothetical protein
MCKSKYTRGVHRTSSEEKEVKDRAAEMLLNAFGNMKNSAAFSEKHPIRTH